MRYDREETERHIQEIRRVGRGKPVDDVFPMKFFDHDGRPRKDIIPPGELCDQVERVRRQIVEEA